MIVAYLNKIIDYVNKSIDIDNSIMIISLIGIGFFIWLSNEIKQQQIDSQKTRDELYEKRIKAYSSVLYEYRYVTFGETNENFF